MRAVIAFGAPIRNHVFATLLASMTALSSQAAVNEPELLEPEKAFRISARALDKDNIEVRFAIADGYYMYRDRFKFETASGRLLADVALPKGTVKQDAFFGKTETYRREVRIRVPVTARDWSRGAVKLKVTSQGCADIGVCYLPLEQYVEVPLPGGSSDPPASFRPHPLSERYGSSDRRGSGAQDLSTITLARSGGITPRS